MRQFYTTLLIRVCFAIYWAISMNIYTETSQPGWRIIMASPTKFFEQDGPYSWIVLITLILCNFSSFGFLMGTLGPLSDLFPQVFDRDQAETNIISSTALAVFSFASKCDTVWISYCFGSYLTFLLFSCHQHHSCGGFTWCDIEKQNSLQLWIHCFTGYPNCGGLNANAIRIIPTAKFTCTYI